MENNKTNILKNLVWVIKQLYNFDKKYLFISISKMIVEGSIPVLSLITMQKIINLLQTKSNFKLLIGFILIYVFIDLFNLIYFSIMTYYNTKFSLGFDLKFNESILKKSSNLKLKSYENSEVYDTIKMAQQESNGKLIAYFQAFTSIISKLITIQSYLVILLSFKPWIVICVLVVPIIKFLLSKKINVMSFNIIKSRTNDSRKSWYLQWLLTYGDSYKELKTYNIFNYFIEKYKDYIKKFNIQDINLAKKNLIWMSTISVFEILVDAMLFVYVIFIGFMGEILIGDVMTYTKTINEIKKLITDVLQQFAEINKESLFIDELMRYFSLEEIDDEGLIKVDEINNIRIKDLSYRYGTTGRYALKNINLEFSKNETYVIVGQNGSGKSTLIKIIMGFYDDYEGEIYINNIELKKIDKSSLLPTIATLFQDFIRYEATFRENISYGNLNLLEEEEKLYSITNKFGITELIKNSAKELDTQIGYWFDKGKQISIGEWQKVALSRAFAKNADLYILDEPNSALDPISEYNLANLYKKLLKNKMGIIIAHKFNNFIKDADKIIVFSNGEVIGKGNHMHLINTNEMYRQLYSIQLEDE
ncbi:TPA: ABC transporter ATP-binding protein [Clostridium botulinum]|uniref:ABC transporter ATP-binding protein n=1 Tax=Clostridium botulinum TaxID=1491 RepID=UPI00131C26C7|nr:ABC transporter ATP-binding protein [Clostridium botulinum]HDK7168652.1 ABC transporter ATP-binding protein [Clostridium botulinum]HDK7169859.1 ABC transporter ATP-binding protein [Clostridium botulinum]